MDACLLISIFMHLLVQICFLHLESLSINFLISLGCTLSGENIDPVHNRDGPSRFSCIVLNKPVNPATGFFWQADHNGIINSFGYQSYQNKIPPIH
jgi:hypothetical protein